MAQGNNVTLAGNITRDPELRFTASDGGRRLRPGGQPPLAEPADQQWEEQTSFFDITCWAQMAENVAESLSRRPHRGHRSPRPAILGDPGR